MRPLRTLALACALVVALTGCVSTSNLESVESPTPTPTHATPAPAEEPVDVPTCTEQVDAWIPIEDSTDGMPGVDLAPEFSATVSIRERGEGTCSPAATRPDYLNESCTPPLGEGVDAIAVSSGSVDYMFAAGATLQVGGGITGFTTAEEQFTYGMVAWLFDSAAEAQAAPIMDAIAACDGVVDATDGDVQRVELRNGDEPHLRLVVDGARIFLYRGLQLTDGSGLSSTESGLLPTAAVDHLEQWWRENGTTVPPAQP